MSRRVSVFAVLGAAVACGLSGCGMSIPADPNGTLDRIEGDVLRAGASLQAQLVERSGDRATGPLADLVDDFAEAHDAEVEWQFGSEETLVTALESRELDIVIGGISVDTPWTERVGVTRGVPGLSVDGREPVLLVPMGQNRLLAELETFVDEQVGS